VLAVRRELQESNTSLQSEELQAFSAGTVNELSLASRRASGLFSCYSVLAFCQVGELQAPLISTVFEVSGTTATKLVSLVGAFQLKPPHKTGQFGSCSMLFWVIATTVVPTYRSERCTY
jgi:hypothetical protein